MEPFAVDLAQLPPSLDFALILGTENLNISKLSDSLNFPGVIIYNRRKRIGDTTNWYEGLGSSLLWVAPIKGPIRHSGCSRLTLNKFCDLRPLTLPSNVALVCGCVVFPSQKLSVTTGWSIYSVRDPSTLWGKIWMSVVIKLHHMTKRRRNYRKKVWQRSCHSEMIHVTVFAKLDRHFITSRKHDESSLLSSSAPALGVTVLGCLRQLWQDGIADNSRPKARTSPDYRDAGLMCLCYGHL